MKLNLRCSLFFLFAAILINTVACYEGSSRKKTGTGDVGPQSTGDGSGTGTKTFYFVLFEPILLSQASLKTADCYVGNSSETTYRFNEWNRRIELITLGLRNLSEKLIVHPIYIEPQDCKILGAIEARASSLINQAGAESVPDKKDTKNRLSLHIKAVFWNNDVKNKIPDGKVTALHWADAIALNAKKIVTRSFLYSVVSNSSFGYFTQWHWMVNTKDTLASPEGISYPDPGVTGIAKREEIIQEDSKTFFKNLIEATKVNE